jgi:hypothetical protein
MQKKQNSKNESENNEHVVSYIIGCLCFCVVELESIGKIKLSKELIEYIVKINKSYNNTTH